MNSDKHFMKLCLELAEQGLGYAVPNPIVGAVLVYNNRIIGKGLHEYYGGPHAEVNCIHSVSVADNHLVSNSTLYVSLEPCNHFGKTPPCTHLIIENKIKKVVIGCQDPFDKVKGSGIQRLKENEVEVVYGVLEAECEFANRRFLTFHVKKRPYVILKWAQSKEGFMAPDNGTQVWLTGDAAKAKVHEWRSQEAAILVGYNTAKIDNPKLTNRSGKGKNPLRIVIDKERSLSSSLHLLSDDFPTVIFNEIGNETKGNKVFVKLNFELSLPEQILSYLYQMEIQSVIIEGGANTLNMFIDSNLWDEARVFETAKEIERGFGVNPLSRDVFTEEIIGRDTLKTYFKR